jgi:hypothetical protein
MISDITYTILYKDGVIAKKIGYKKKSYIVIN